jgi:hypothetical protein
MTIYHQADDKSDQIAIISTPFALILAPPRVVIFSVTLIIALNDVVLMDGYLSTLLMKFYWDKCKKLEFVGFSSVLC